MPSFYKKSSGEGFFLESVNSASYLPAVTAGNQASPFEIGSGDFTSYQRVDEVDNNKSYFVQHFTGTGRYTERFKIYYEWVDENLSPTYMGNFFILDGRNAVDPTDIFSGGWNMVGFAENLLPLDSSQGMQNSFDEYLPTRVVLEEGVPYALAWTTNDGIEINFAIRYVPTPIDIDEGTFC